MKQTIRTFGIPVLVLLALLVVVAPQPANAAVRFGVYLGGPAYYPAYPYAYSYPYYDPYYYNPYGYPYAYSYAYPYGYARPYYGTGLYWGGGHRERFEHREREFRGGERGFRGGANGFRGGEHRGNRR